MNEDYVVIFTFIPGCFTVAMSTLHDLRDWHDLHAGNEFSTCPPAK